MSSVGDPLHVHAARLVAYPGDRQVLALSASNADGTGRTGIAASLRIDVFDPDNLLVISAATPIEVTPAAGVYRYAFDVGPAPKAGAYLVVVRTTDLIPASASTAYAVAAAPPATAAQVQALLAAARQGLDAHLNVSQQDLEAYIDGALDDAVSWAMDQANVTFHVENITVDHFLLQRIDDNLTRLDNATQAHVASLEDHRALSPEYTAAEAQESWLQTIGQLAWVIWGLYFVATRFVRPTLLRILVDLVGFGLLALPIPDGQVEILFFAPLAATGWDAFRYTEEHL